MTALLAILSVFIGMLVIMFVAIPIALCMFLLEVKFCDWIFDLFGM